MMSRVNEFLELPICHGMGIDPEVTDGDAMNRRFFRIMLVGSHAERTARNPDHAFGIGIATRSGVTVSAQVDL
jgi:hypothetical protein